MLHLIVLFRIFNALVVETYFNADEYYQSLEVAHKIVFGTPTQLTWEWHPETTLRGYLHPLMFAGLYKLMQITGLTYPILFVILPRILQSIFSAIGDWYVYQTTKKWFSSDIAMYALWCSITNWFHFYCGVRTFSNSMETPLFVIMLYHYPLYPFTFKKIGTPLSYAWIFYAGLSCVIRPTNALICAPLFINQCLYINKHYNLVAVLRFITTKFIPLL
jgi:phosphatidylinositol glycan class B